MKMKITGRDVKFFFLDVFTIILIDVILDFESVKNGFFDGYNAARNDAKIENSK